MNLFQSRRRFLCSTAAIGMALAGGSRRGRAEDRQEFPPVRQLTHGPAHHWFGYYDKLEFDPTGRYLLGMEVDFEHRSPRANDVIRIGMIDLHDKDRWIPLGTSSAWCWQQGCMLQWIPGSRDTIVWNDREGAEYVCRVLNVHSRTLRTIPHPIYALSPDGKTAISTDFRRLGECRPGYGYNGIADPFASVATPRETGLYQVNLETGKQDLLLSIAYVASIGPQLPSMKKSPRHWFNHLLFNPDGTRFVFLHRWQVGEGRETRMLVADANGLGLRTVDANGLTSHFNWRDPDTLLAWSRQGLQGNGFYQFDVGGRDIEQVGRGILQQDGHCSYLPNPDWILCDTYPDRNRDQHPYLFHLPTSKKVPLGKFPSPAQYTGEWRCDLHPRSSPDGKSIVVDSPVPGEGRQLHLIDVSRIVA